MQTSSIAAFQGTTRLAQGTVADVLTAVLSLPLSERGSILFFDLATGQQTDYDLVQPLQPNPRSGPGRPKLGVVSTEVTLLPRHWTWLNAQPGRASGTLRRLVEAAMAAEQSDPKKRLGALGKILWSLAGNEPDFEEASRALYAGDRARLNALAERWPGDLPRFVKEWS